MNCYIRLCIKIAILVCCLTACNSTVTSEADKPVKQSPAATKLPALSAAEISQMQSRFRAEVLNAEYAKYIDKCTYYPLYSDTSKAPVQVREVAKIIAQRVGSDIPAQSFTASERKRLGVQVLPNGSCFNIWDLDSALIGFYMKYNTMPASAEDYLTKHGCFAQANLTRCLNMSQEDRFNMLASLVDPSTGKLYASFQSKAWVPFGINAEVVPKEQRKKVMPEIDHLRLGDPGTEGVAPGVMFHIVHYGERPNSIIEDYVTCQP